MSEQELTDQLDELEESLREVIDKAFNLAKNTQGIFSGQIRQYFCPTLNSFILSDHQPGSIASLRRLVEQTCEEE